MFKTLITLIGSKARLYIEYAILAAVLALGCAALTFYWKTKVLETMPHRLRQSMTL
jgi:hypothetical protein